MALIWDSRTDVDWDNAVQGCDYIKPGTERWIDQLCSDGDPKWHDRHNGVGNVFFVDGHVKAVTANSFLLPHNLYAILP